jgi:hypothetical protein
VRILKIRQGACNLVEPKAASSIQYEHAAAKMIAEMGRLLGGWMKVSGA